MMFGWRRKEEWWQLFRYYQAGIANMMFGYVLFSFILWCGLHVYVAQALGHIVGMIFNYFTYSRYAFAGRKSSRISFVMSYFFNYILSLAGLWAALKMFPSPYAAGLATTVAISAINFFILKRLVFRLPVGA